MAGRRIDQLFYEITARTGGFDRGLDASNRKMRGFVGRLGVASTAIAAFGAAAVAAGIKATRMAAALDASLREVSTLLPGTVENVSRLRDEVVALSTEVPQTPELLSRGLYQVISAGISDTAEAMDVLRVSARAAVAGLTDTFTSVDAITTVLNAYQLETSEAARVSDVFFATLREGKLTFEDIASNIGGVATSAALAGVSIEEVGAAMATLTKFGIGTAEATTSLNRLFLSLTNVTDEAAAAAEEMGIELSTAALRSKGLVGFLRDLERATGGNIDQLAALIPEIRAARGVFVLAGQGADEYRRILDQTNDATGQTDTAFEKMNGSLDNQATLLKNRINAAWLDLGTKTLPIVLAVLKQINTLLQTDAERLAEAFRVLGDEARAASIILAEQRRRTTDEFAETARTIEERIDGIVRANERLRAVSGGATPLAALPDEDVAALFPTDIRESLDQGLDVTREILETTIEYAEELAKAPDITLREAEALAQLVEGRRELLGLLDQQAARVRSLATGDTGTGVEPPEPPDMAPTLTEAERKALDLRDALLSADAVLRDMGESGADLLSEVPNVIADLQSQLDDLASGLDADFEDFSLDARLLSAQRAIEGVTRSGATFGQQALAVQGILDQWGIEVDQLPPGFREVVRAIIEARGEAEDVSRELRDIINDVSFAARGAVELANAFGLVGDEAAAAVNQIALIGEGIGRIASGDILSGIGGVASGIAGLVGGLFGGGPSEEELARRQSLEDNNRRLRELNDRLDILAGVLRGLPGGLVQSITDALAGPIADLDSARGGTGGFFTDALREAEAASGIGDALARAGVSITDVQQAAAELGLDADQLIRLLEGEDLDFPQLREATQQAEALFDALDTGLERALDTVRGRLDLLQDAFDVLDIDDPAEQLRLIASELERAGTALSAADIERLAAGDEAFIEELFNELRSGSGRFTDLDAFGELSFDEFLDILRQMEGIQDRIADGVEGAGEGDFQQVSAVNRLTVEQGDRMLAQDATRNFLLEDIRNRMRDGVPVITVTDSMLSAASTVRVEHSFGAPLVVEWRGENLSPEAAAIAGRETGFAIGESLAVDRSMGESLRRQRAGLGLPPTRTQ